MGSISVNEQQKRCCYPAPFFLCLCPQGGSANKGELDVASICALRFWL